MSDIKGKILLITLIIIAVFVVLVPRLMVASEGFYPYPLHDDEWQHYTIAMSLKDNFFQPTVFYYQEPEKFIDGSPLFHWFLFFLQKLGFQPQDFYILPVLQGIFFIVVFFLLISAFFNDYRVGFTASLLALFVRSDIKVLGILFFKPFFVGFIFFLLTLLILHKRRHITPPFLIVSLIVFLYYPPIILLSMIYVFVYLWINRGTNRRNLFWIVFLTIFVFIFGIFITKGDPSLLFNKIIYKNFWSGFSKINLIKYLGVPLIVFGILGIAKTIKNKELLPLHSVFGFFVLNFIMTISTGYSLGFHYVRTFYLGALIFSIYSGYGVCFVFERLEKKVKKKLALLIYIIILILTVSHTFIFYLNLSDDTLNPSLLINFRNNDVIEAMSYLKDFQDKNRKVLHPPEIGSIITPLSGFKATLLHSGLTGGKMNRYYEMMIYNSCKNLKEIMEEGNYQLLILYKSVNQNECPFLKSVFENKTIIIYGYQES